MNNCRAVLEGNTLILENSRIRRTFDWNHGHLVSREITDKAGGQTWTLAGTAPDCSFPGEATEGTDGELRVISCPATPIRPAHLQADVTTRRGGLEMLRRFRIYPDCPAIACDFYLRGRPSAAWGTAAAAETGLANVENAETLRQGQGQAVVIDRLQLPQRHLRLECVQFFDVTDRRNTLVTSRAILPYRYEAWLPGNLLLVRDVLADRGLFILKEAPCSDAQLAWPGCDFISKIGEVQVAGVGLEPGDLNLDEWTRGYGCVVGVATGGEYGLLSALRSYQEQIRIHQPGRDGMILLNTWGDRGQDTRIREAFALAELEAAARARHHALPTRRRLAGRPILQLRDRGRLAGGYLDAQRLLGAAPRAIPERARPGGRAEQGAGHRAVPLVQPQQGRQLRSLARRCRRADRPQSAVRHPHLQDRRCDDPRQARRPQPARDVRAGDGRHGRAGGLQPRCHCGPALGLPLRQRVRQHLLGEPLHRLEQPLPTLDAAQPLDARRAPCRRRISRSSS